jgi:hypothetical protein
MRLQGKIFLAGLVALAVSAAADGRPEKAGLKIYPSGVLQRLIDRAGPGETVRIPPGIYEGSVVVRKDVTLKGAGTRRTILDGKGAECVLRIEGGASASKLAVRGGLIGVEFRGPGGTLQDSVVAWNQRYGVHCLASAVLFNNRIYGNGDGVAVNSRAPVLLHNTIAGNRDSGVWSWYGPGPTLIHNLVTHNSQALMTGAGSQPELKDNVEWANGKLVEGFKVEAPGYDDPLDGRLSPVEGTPLAEAVELSALLRRRPGHAAGGLYPVGYLGARRAEVELDAGKVRAFVRRFEPRLTYRLTPEPGVFQVEIAFARPPFQIGASEQATHVEVLRAWDSKGKIELYAQAQKGEVWSIRTDALDPDAPLESARYRLLCEFVDPGALRLEGDRMIFERVTSLESVDIEAPEGWKLRRLPARQTKKGRLVAAEMTRIQPEQP